MIKRDARVYLAIKYDPQNRNRQLIEQLAAVIEQVGWSSHVVVRDLEAWGEKSFAPGNLMENSLALLSTCDLCLVEGSVKGVGVGIEAGYAYAKGIPVVVIASMGTNISTTLTGIAQTILYYESPHSLAGLFPGLID